MLTKSPKKQRICDGTVPADCPKTIDEVDKELKICTRSSFQAVPSMRSPENS